jgi:hypothetical protein
MSAQEISTTNNLQRLSITYKKDQYTLWQILGIWLVGSAPMWLLSWVAYPASVLVSRRQMPVCCA